VGVELVRDTFTLPSVMPGAIHRVEQRVNAAAGIVPQSVVQPGVGTGKGFHIGIGIRIHERLPEQLV
jgi:hypothetical protein